MMEFLIYQGKTAVLLAAFYMFYRLLLSKETFHRLNRTVLLGTAVLSFILPFCVITIHKVVSFPAAQQEFQMNESADMAAGTISIESAQPLWPYVVCAIFVVGALVVLSSTVISIIKVMGIVRSGEQKVMDSGEILVMTQENIPPFSWMKYIVLSKDDYEGDCSQILVHEKAHIALKHSWDILLLDFISALQWFNPAIWMLKADLRTIHEFEADDAVLRSGANVKEYQYLLIKKAVGKSGYSVANSFNHSTLKQRITMMSNKKSTRMSAWKALYVIPLVGISLAATAETKVDYRYSELQPAAVTDTLKAKGNETLGNGPVKFAKHNPDGTKISLNPSNTLYVENGNIMPQGYNLDKINPDSIFSLKILQKSQAIEKYGKAAEDKEGAVEIKLVGYSELKVEQLAEKNSPLYIQLYPWGEEKQITKAELDNIDKNRIQSIEVMKNSDAKKKYGEKAANGAIVIAMKMPNELDALKVISYRNNPEESNSKFYIVKPDVKASFNGEGVEGFYKWLFSKMARPKGCEHQGTMKVSFVIGTEGKVTDVKILESVCEELDNMVVSAIKNSPAWEPAKVKGKPVEWAVKMPFVFELR